MSIRFADDNIDKLVVTPTGQGSFNGTVLVVFQRRQNAEVMNQPLVIPDTLPDKPQTFDLRYLPEPNLDKRPIKYQNYALSASVPDRDFNTTWALVNYLISSCNKTRNAISGGSEQEENVVRTVDNGKENEQIVEDPI